MSNEKDEKQVTPEEAKKIIAQENTRILTECKAEIAAVLQKHNCEYALTRFVVTLQGMQMAFDPSVVTWNLGLRIREG
jgi:hypothetical protein